MDLHVTCSALGSVRVSVATTGTDLDGNGYTVVAHATSFPGSVAGSLPTSDATTVLRVAAGRYVTTLQGVAANCDGGDIGPREIDVVSGATQTLDFAVVCEPARRLAYVAAFETENAEIYTVRSDGTGAVRLTNNLAEDTDPAWSPDGTRIAFVSVRDVIAADVYVMNADGTGERRLTDHRAVDTDPAWSPDGARIAFSSERDGNADIYIMNADGSGVTRLTTNTEPDGYPAAWSPDGTRVAFSGTQCDGGWDGYCYPGVFVTGPQGTPVAVGPGADPAWSPDGRKLAVRRLACDYYDPTCSTVGLGILVPFTDATAGSQQTWDPELTAGQHGKPTWRP
jgi:dipeptidyl aminopeptidase/acylaminoacyl peptidase